jgi:hypothetical protein
MLARGAGQKWDDGLGESRDFNVLKMAHVPAPDYGFGFYT